VRILAHLFLAYKGSNTFFVLKMLWPILFLYIDICPFLFESIIYFFLKNIYNKDLHIIYRNCFSDNMSDRLENIFINFANSQEELLSQMNLTKEEFVENAKKWSETEDGKLEIQKFILNQEIDDLKSEIIEIEKNIAKKEESIREIDEELSKLNGDDNG
jgi:hypothetical protein